MINGLEARVNAIEDKLSDLDARGSEESDNLTNERNLDRFVMSGVLCISHSTFTFHIVLLLVNLLHPTFLNYVPSNSEYSVLHSFRPLSMVLIVRC